MQRDLGRRALLCGCVDLHSSPGPSSCSPCTLGIDVTSLSLFPNLKQRLRVEPALVGLLGERREQCVPGTQHSHVGSAQWVKGR